MEGYFDVVAAHKAGVKNVVAVSGTALTEDHVRLLKRYADSVVLCLDQDRAGRQAADRAFQLLSKAHTRVQSVAIPSKDPDELVQKDAALFANIVANSATEYVEGVIEQMRTMPDIQEPKGRMRITETLFPLLGAVPTSVELRSYLEKMTVAFGMRITEIEADFRAWRAGAETPSRKVEAVAIAEQTPFTRLQLCIGLAIVYVRARPLLAELIPPDEENWNKVRLALAAADEKTPVETVLTQAEADSMLKEQVGVLTMYCEENFPSWSDTIALREMKKLCAATNRELMVRKQNEIVAELKEARKSGRADEEVRLLTKY
ncbi:MAG TPA: toprim domain-containing protein, partial [Candidatus Peribacteria bacterium]|nr:toprim domain-containing protein [Candidatus Peribacteria bacterium]